MNRPYAYPNCKITLKYYNIRIQKHWSAVVSNSTAKFTDKNGGWIVPFRLFA